MNRAAAMLCMLIPASAMLPPSQAMEPLQPFTISYDVRHNSMLLARMERRLRADGDGGFILEAESRPAGMLSAIRRDHVVERSEWLFIDDRPRPVRYEYHHSGRRDERHVVLKFDWDKGSVINIINDDPWRMDIPDDALDKLLYQYTMMLDLQQGARVLDYRIADGGELKTYRFEPVGEEVLDTAIGKLRTLKLQRNHGDRKTFIWCAIDRGYLPVRFEQHRDRRMVTVTITRVSQARP